MTGADVAHELGHAGALRRLGVPCTLRWDDADQTIGIEFDLPATDDLRLRMAQIAIAGPAGALGYRYERSGAWPATVSLDDVRREPTASGVDLASIADAPSGSGQALAWAVGVGLAAGRDCARNPSAVADVLNLVVHQRQPLEIVPERP